MNFFAKRPNVVTHSGAFHPDDITAVAVLEMFLGRPVKVIRSRKAEDWTKADYIFDVGGEYDPAKNKFDHHQESFTMKRPNGIPYSSAGLAWKYFGEKVAGSHDVWQKIDEKIIQPLDAEDNGVEILKNIFDDVLIYSFADYLYGFNNTWKEKKRSSLDAFKQAVAEVKKMLAREISRAKDSFSAEEKVKEIYKNTSDKRIIIFDDNFSWKKTLIKFPEPLFAISPDFENNLWQAKAVGMEGFKFKNRVDFPESWAGKAGEELQKITGVSDATFCHKGRFICVAKSRESAIKLAKLALESKSL